MVKNKNIAPQKEGLLTVQEKLAAFTGGKRVVLGGRANTLWAALLRCIKQKPYVVFPAIMCPSPIFVAQYLGFKPLLCDVREQDGLICPDSLLSLLNSYGDQIAAVLAVDLYGNRPCMERLDNLCKANSVFLVEDAAQALGVANMGQHCDACLVSFGHTKIIDCGFGGALLTDNEELVKNVASKLDTFNYCDVGRIKWLSEVYSRCYYSIRELIKAKPEAAALYGNFSDYFYELYFVKTDVADWKNILSGVAGLEDNLARRRYHTSVYMEQLNELPIRPVGFWNLDLCAPWRFTFSINPEVRDDLLAWLWCHKVDASFWYPSMEGWFYEPKGSDSCPVAGELSRCIINLWVDKPSMDYSRNVAQCVLDFFRRKNRRR